MLQVDNPPCLNNFKRNGIGVWLLDSFSKRLLRLLSNLKAKKLRPRKKHSQYTVSNKVFQSLLSMLFGHFFVANSNMRVDCSQKKKQSHFDPFRAAPRSQPVAATAWFPGAYQPNPSENYLCGFLTNKKARVFEF